MVETVTTALLHRILCRGYSCLEHDRCRYRRRSFHVVRPHRRQQQHHGSPIQVLFQMLLTSGTTTTTTTTTRQTMNQRVQRRHYPTQLSSLVYNSTNFASPSAATATVAAALAATAPCPNSSSAGRKVGIFTTRQRSYSTDPKNHNSNTNSNSNSNNNHTDQTNNENNNDSNNQYRSTHADKIQLRRQEIQDYNEKQIETMQFFQSVMTTIDPKDMPDPIQYVDCRTKLQYYAFVRIPPTIQYEWTRTPTTTSSSSSGSTDPPATKSRNSITTSSSSSSSSSPTPTLLHTAIRQSTSHSQLAMALLERGHYNAKSHPWMIGWSMVQGNEIYTQPESFYIQRYQGLWRYQLVQRIQPKIGDIIVHDPIRMESLVMQYHRDLRTHYSNAPTFPNTSSHKTYPMGPIHVALGFNDLQILLHHVDHDDNHHSNNHNIGIGKERNESTQTTTSMTNYYSNDKPMKFYGYDRSTYSIAKTLVIVQMLRQASVTPHHIVEAWYSSTWNYETLMLFRYTCMTLLQDDTYRTNHYDNNHHLPTSSFHSCPKNVQEEVRQYLHHWAYDAIPISDVDAIQRWLYESSDGGQVYTQSCSFPRRSDRTALVEYFMTGEFGTKYSQVRNSIHQTNTAVTATNTEMVGSLAMWSVPPWAPPSNKSDQDRVNNTILLQSILDEINRTDEDISIVEAMYHIKVRQVQKLQHLVQTQKLQIYIRYGDIQPLHLCSGQLLDEIRDLNATTMSWSNLVDYFDMGLFHELAQHWSRHNEVTHYGYSMNWPTTCFGTSISDYATTRERKEILFATLDTARTVSETLGLEKMITLPTFEHTEDQTGDWLGRKLSPKWVDYFKKEGKKLLPDHDIIVKDEMQLYSPILRTTRSIYLTWMYK
jgi:hypothetical protein